MKRILFTFALLFSCIIAFAQTKTPKTPIVIIIQGGNNSGTNSPNLNIPVLSAEYDAVLH